MRRRFFKRILLYLERHPSTIFARIEIQILLMVTAKAFQQKSRCVLLSKDPLSEYANYTVECLDAGTDAKRLYRHMYLLGRRIRNIAGFTDKGDCKRLLFLLYRNIGITMTGEIPGHIQIAECFFSLVYSAEQCRMISAMDAGIVAGLCGGRLKFCQRITEGCQQCKALVKEKDWVERRRI